MYEKGYIYKGLKPVYWCPSCQTALAEAEIEYADHKSKSIYVKFEVTNSKGLFDEKDTYLVIWTTTPWTLPGNTAITISDKYDYALVNIKKDGKEENYIVMDDMVEDLMKTFGIEEYKKVKTITNKELEGVEYKHPFLDRISKVILGSDDTILVEKGSGTGLVHTAPAYGNEDYLAGKKYRIEMYVAVDEKGMQTEKAGIFAGMYYKKSNDAIIEHLNEQGNLIKLEEINHSYPHCWRCKNPIIYRAADQWFASVEGFRKKALEAIETVKWFPEWGEERIRKMIADRGDWCISRQRTWGVPLPIFYDKETGKEYITKGSMEKVKEIVGKEGTNAWYEKTVEQLLPDEVLTLGKPKSEYVKEKDIMDVWFDSGSTHQSVIKQRGIGEIDLYLEGSDQYRGWFQSSLLTSVATTGKAPYKQVITHRILS